MIKNKTKKNTRHTNKVVKTKSNKKTIKLVNTKRIITTTAASTRSEVYKYRSDAVYDQAPLIMKLYNMLPLDIRTAFNKTIIKFLVDDNNCSYELATRLWAAVLYCESGLNMEGLHPWQGAYGLYQLTNSTAEPYIKKYLPKQYPLYKSHLQQWRRNVVFNEEGVVEQPPNLTARLNQGIMNNMKRLCMIPITYELMNIYVSQLKKYNKFASTLKEAQAQAMMKGVLGKMSPLVKQLLMLYTINAEGSLNKPGGFAMLSSKYTLKGTPMNDIYSTMLAHVKNLVIFGNQPMNLSNDQLTINDKILIYG